MIRLSPQTQRLLLPRRRQIEGLPDEYLLDILRRMRRNRYAKANGFITDLITLLFQNTAGGSISAIGSGLRNATTAGSLYLSLHTADPGAAGSQTTSEAAYTSYARQAVARSNVGFTISSQSVQLAALVGFPACTGAPETETHWGIGTAATLAGNLLYSGALGSNIGNGTALASNDTFTVPGLGALANGNQVSFYAPPGSTLPAGITSGTLYFVVSLSGDTFKVSATSGGTAIDVTADGAFIAFKHSPIVVTASPQVTPQIQAGTIITEF